MLQFFVGAFVLYCVLGMLNIYLYLTKVLPALRRKYGHADWKVWSVELLCQVDEYISILDMAKSNPWFYCSCLFCEGGIASLWRPSL
jgi:hypothetical protein